MRSLFLILAAVVLTAGFVSPALACINDRELESHEKEFKSTYPDQPAETPSPDSGVTNAFIAQAVGASTLGGALLAGAIVLGLTRVSNRRE